MLGPIAEKFFFKGYIWCGFLQCLPYRFNSKTRTVREGTSFQFLIWYYCLFGNAVVILWMALRTTQMYFRKEESIEYFSYYMICYVMSVFTLLPCCLQASVWRSYKDIPLYQVLYINFIKSYKEKYVLPKTKPKTLKEKLESDEPGVFMMYLYYSLIVMLILFIIIGTFNPQLPVLPTSFMELPRFLYIPVAVFQQYIILHYMCSLYGLIFFIGIPAVDYMFSFVEIIQELDLSKSTFTTTNKLRTESELMSFCRQLQILHNLVSDIHCPIIIPSYQWLFLVTVVYSIYGCIKIGGLIGILMLLGLLTCVLFLFVSFTLYAEMLEMSTEAMKSWSIMTNKSKLFQKFTRSCKPMGIAVGGVYFADRDMVMSMGRFIVESTADLFLLS